jgi:hypothetical protein
MCGVQGDWSGMAVAPMILPAEVRRRLQGERGLVLFEACDHCGQLLGPVRSTRMDEPGVWCSRECRDGKEAHAPGTCWNCGTSLAGLRRGTKFCSDVCRVRSSRKSQTAQNSRNEQLKTQGLQTRVEVLAVPTQQGAETSDSELMVGHRSGTGSRSLGV